MLPTSLRPLNFENESWNKEPWSDYRVRIVLTDNEAIEQFYRQVAYDHFDHFNEHYPNFCLDDYSIALEQLTAQEANDKIRFFQNNVMDQWNAQFDYYEEKDQQYVIFQEMRKNLTPPFPPVLIETSSLIDSGWRAYGRPLHLIEGTHRVSYLRRMLELRLIKADSRHEFVVLRPNK